MSSHSPQRPRKSQAHQTQGSLHNIVPPRETSPSPSFNQRPRNIKTNSMPSVLQLFDNANRQSPQQHSPTSASRRSPPLPVGQIQRGLPTPPHPNVAIPAVQAQDRRVNSPSPPHITHYPRPVNRHLSSQFLASFQGVDENLHMTDELLADIERADMQKMQGIGHPVSSYHGKDDASVSPVVERIRNTGKSSPKDLDGRRQHRPQSRDKQPSSPPAQTVSHTPERRSSPSFHSPLASSGDSSSTYVSRSQRSPLSLTLPTHSPPTLATVRTPDKSLPVQEEPEDETLHIRSQNEWMGRDNEPERRVSPAPSSDLHPEGNARRSYRDETIRGMPNGRNSRTGHRKEDDDTLVEQSVSVSSSRDDEEGHTPRSPAAGLPEIPHDRYQQPRSSAPAAPSRGRNRTAATDQLGLRGFDPAFLDQSGHAQERDEPPQYAESKPSTQRSARDTRNSNSHARYYTPQILPDDFMRDPTSAYLHALMGASPRPDAPIPPTPHSQTTPPSPSQASYDPRHELPPFSPVAPVGSPYPYPFTHVRRNRPSSYQGGTNEGYDNIDLNHPSVISEQMKRQYQIYAQNNLGHISDSTFSPASTPYPGHANYFNQWANWHTHKLLGVGTMGNVVRDPMSIRSSPSHEPISLPAPPTIGLRKKDTRTNLRRANSMGTRKPPPRVDSTQPRETSPEPSSSGESTAGEDPVLQQHFALPDEGSWVNGSLPLPPIITRDEELGDWIDEDEEEDEDDLLELEFHPSYVNNVEKRRRRWETKWEALIQAFQTLDRQTDATLVLMAAPSHSSKMHLVTSRSIRRQPNLARSPMLTGLRMGFRQMAIQRRSARSLRSSLADRFLTPQSSSPGDGSVASAETREEDLKRALGAALGSLGALGRIYEQREARWKEEMSRISEDRERIEMLLRQALGDRDPQTL